MHTTFLNPYFLPFRGAVEMQMFELARRLKKRHKISVVTSRVNSSYSPDDVIEGIPVHRLKAMNFHLYNPPLLATYPLRIRTKLMELRPDLLHLSNRWAPEYIKASITHRSQSKTPIIYHACNSWVEGGPMLRGINFFYEISIVKPFLRRCDGLIALSQFVADQFVHMTNFPAERVTVIPNGINPSQKKFSHSSGTTIFFIGRLVDLKGVEYLIRALPAILKEAPDARLVIAGEGPDKARLKALAKVLGIEDKISFLGYVDNETGRELMRKSSVVVMPSLFEAAGLVALEAMAEGRAVVASNVGGLPEYVQDGKTGFLTELKNPEDIARKVTTILSDAKLRRGFERKAKLASSQYTFEKLGKSFEKFLENTLANPRF